MKEITKEDIEKFEHVIKLTKAQGNDVKIIQRLMTEYVDPKCHVCPNCSSQIRFAHKRLTTHYARYNEYVKTLEIKNDNQPDIRECRSCGEDISNLRKTIKYCNECRQERK